MLSSFCTSQYVCGTGVSCKPVVILFMYTLSKFSSILRSDHFPSYLSTFNFLTVYCQNVKPERSKKREICFWSFWNFEDHLYYTVCSFRKLHKKKKPNKFILKEIEDAPSPVSPLTDVLRYTLVCKPDHYAATVKACVLSRPGTNGTVGTPWNPSSSCSDLLWHISEYDLKYMSARDSPQYSGLIHAVMNYKDNSIWTMVTNGKSNSYCIFL